MSQPVCAVCRVRAAPPDRSVCYTCFPLLDAGGRGTGSRRSPPVDDLAALAALHAAVRELRAAATPHERG